MAVVSMKKLLEAGVHFGHQTRRWNPKMKKYIYSARNDIHIIDLQQTVLLAEQAYDFVRDLAKDGKSVLFVGTKKQAQAAVESEATRCGMYYINNRWLGGTLTNHKTIRTRIERLNHINQMEAMGEFALLPKKEVASLKSERDKLQANLGGIKDMKSMPGCLFIVDCKKEAIAIAEAHILGIPIVAIVDTNCDPDDVTCVIPGNDDAIGAIKIIASVIANAVIEAREGIIFQVEEEEDKEGRVPQKQEDARQEGINAEIAAEVKESAASEVQSKKESSSQE